MKTLREIESEVTALGQLIGVGPPDLPSYGASSAFAHPHIEVANGLYHYVIVEHGEEQERRSTERYEDLLYWIFDSVTHNLAFDYELSHRVEDQDCRRIAFPKQVELMRKISTELGDRLQAQVSEILIQVPYDDEPIRALNRMRRGVYQVGQKLSRQIFRPKVTEV